MLLYMKIFLLSRYPRFILDTGDDVLKLVKNAGIDEVYKILSGGPA